MKSNQKLKSNQKRKGAPMNRRDVLMSAGCLLMLPALESFGQEAKGDDAVKANRLFCIKPAMRMMRLTGLRKKLFLIKERGIQNSQMWQFFIVQMPKVELSKSN